MAANSIEMSLDSSTFRRWSRALENLCIPRAVRVRTVGTFHVASALPDAIRFTGLRLLLQIGRACSRPEVVDDPSRLFGLLRYATTLSAGVGWLLPDGGHARSLSLVSSIQILDSHKKAVLSDEFGCGMAFALSGQALGTIFYLDVETALRLKWLRTQAPKSRRPDYFAARLSSPNPWVVLEAKGSQSGDTYCRATQVPDGCDQLSKVQLVGPGAGSAIRLAVAASLYREGQRNQSKVFVGDPEPNSPDPYEFTEAGLEATVRSHYLRIAMMTGDTRLANRMASGQDTDANDEDALVFDEFDGRKFAGSRVVFIAADSSIQAFVGLDVTVRRELLKGNLTGLAHRLSQSVGTGQVSRSRGDETDSEKGESPADTNLVAEMEHDGTVLVLKRFGRIAEKRGNS